MDAPTLVSDRRNNVLAAIRLGTIATLLLSLGLIGFTGQEAYAAAPDPDDGREGPTLIADQPDPEIANLEPSVTGCWIGRIRRNGRSRH